MKALSVLTPHHPRFAEAIQFVDEVYIETLHVHARNAPDIIIAAHDNMQMYGCIGFNFEVSWRFFKNDPRVQKVIAEYPAGTTIGEQSMFAARHFPAGITLLISTLAAYAKRQHVDKIVFAGIGVSCKTTTQLGYDVHIVGPTRDAVTGRADKKSYAYWLDTFEPVTCILDTTKAETIQQKLQVKYEHKARPSAELDLLIA